MSTIKTLGLSPIWLQLTLKHRGHSASVRAEVSDSDRPERVAVVDHDLAGVVRE